MFDKSTRIELQIAGMSCMHCVKRVENAILNVKGVKKAQVNLESGTAQVEYNSSKTDINELIDAVTSVGFSATESKS